MVDVDFSCEVSRGGRRWWEGGDFLTVVQEAGTGRFHHVASPSVAILDLGKEEEEEG